MSDSLYLSLVIYALAIAISLGVALLVRLLVALLGRALRQPAPPPAQAGTQTRPPPAHVAAIAAVLADVLGPHRIIRISERDHLDGWSQEGRAAHHQSHNLPRRPRS